MAVDSYEKQLHEAVAEFYDDPLGFVLCMFPWGEPGELEAYSGPGPEQTQFLTWLGEEIRERAFNGRDAVPAIKGAISSGHGIGKGALAGMLVAFIMSTRPYAKGVVTANTGPQLQDKTWAQITRWVKLCKTAHWFEINTSIMYRRGYRESWKCSPQTCAEENSEAFAGQHNLNSTSFFINDEDSNVPLKIHEVQEGGMTDGEPMWFLFGNPTRRTGFFYDAVFGNNRHRWKGFVFDSEQSPLSNKQQIQEWREDHGEDSDFFRVRVRGLPPNASDAQFIDHQRVLDAQRREVVVLDDEPLVAGCDLAWGGVDKNVIRFRRGRDARSIPPIEIPGQLSRDPAVLTNRLSEVLTQTYNGKKVAMLFLDSAGIAGAIGTRLRQMGFHNVLEVNFGADSPSPLRRFMRDHMWAEMKEWLLVGAIDKHPRLEVDLQAPGLRQENKQRVWLESKEDIKKRGEKSPDHADALCLTFAQSVATATVPVTITFKPTTKWG